MPVNIRIFDQIGLWTEQVVHERQVLLDVVSDYNQVARAVFYLIHHLHKLALVVHILQHYHVQA